MSILIKQSLIVVLTVDVDKKSGAAPQHCYGNQPAVYPGLRPPVCINIPLKADKTVIPRGYAVLAQRFRFALGEIAENTADHSFALAGTNKVFVGTVSHQKAYRADYDRFSGAGFSGKHVKAPSEINIYRPGYRNILDMQGNKHSKLPHE
jgi:hypothetical protein